MGGGPHVDSAAGASGAAPDGATKYVKGYAGFGMRWAGAACGPCHWGLRCSTLWGHETCKGYAEIGMRWAGGRMWTLPQEQQND